MTITWGSSSTGDGRNALPVQLECLQGAAGVEVVREGERQPEDAGELRAVTARAEQEDLRARRRHRGRSEALPEATLAPDVAQQAHQVEQVTREVLGAERFG